MPGSRHDPNPRWNPHAAVAGWILPGLGHWILGMRRRGIVLCITISSLWLGGILIGGISVIDRYDRSEAGASNAPPKRSDGTSMWFIGQALLAPSIAVDRIRANMYDDFVEANGANRDAHPNLVLRPWVSAPPYEPSIARVAEQGVLFTALAGLLNLLAMIDVLYCDASYRRDRDNSNLKPAESDESAPSAPPAQSTQEAV